MPATGLAVFDHTIHITNIWLDEIMQELHWEDDRQKAYQALRSVLQALRDRLTIQEATDLGAQLPMLIRGIFFEGYNPSGKPLRERKKEEFLAHVKQNYPLGELLDVQRVIQAVFSVLSRHVTQGEIDDVRSNLPRDFQDLWPALQPTGGEPGVRDN